MVQVNKKAGRKPTYTNQQLIEALNKYVIKNPNTKITLAGLQKESGISYNIWKFNTKIRSIIDDLNNPPIIASESKYKFTLPNAEQLVNVHYRNKPKLIKTIQDSFDVISDLYDYANIGFKAKQREDKISIEIKELKAIIETKDCEIKKLNDEIDKLYVDSNSPLERKNKGIKENLIELTPERIRSISKDPKEIAKEYATLFDN